MKYLIERRASIILFNYLKSIDPETIFLLPANICPIVLTVFFKAKINFKLLDIDKDTLCISHKLVDLNLKDKNKYGILYVRTFGYNNPQVISFFNSLRQLNPDLIIIDDRCLCIPKFEINIQDKLVDLILYSTGYAKFVELGYGGFGWISNQLAYKTIKLNYIEQDYDNLIDSFYLSIKNEKKFIYTDSDWLNTLKLEESIQDYNLKIKTKLEDIIKIKQERNLIYQKCIPSTYWLGEKFNNWRFSILVKNKNELLKEIFKAGFFASSHYASLTGIFDDCRNNTPNANKIQDLIVNLFNDDRVTKDDVKKISKIVVEKGIPWN